MRHATLSASSVSARRETLQKKSKEAVRNVALVSRPKSCLAFEPSARYGGLDSVHILVSMLTPMRLEEFTSWLRQRPEVRHVYSYSDVIKRLNKNLHGDDPAWYRIPQDCQAAAQYLLLYELSLPFGLDLNDRVNIDKSATRVTASLDEISTAGVRDFLDQSQDEPDPQCLTDPDDVWSVGVDGWRAGHGGRGVEQVRV